MHARSTTILADRDLIDDGITHIRDTTLPMLMGVEGCIGMSMLVDRESGRCIVTSAWQTPEDMHASEEAVRRVRERTAGLMGDNGPRVDRWEIAVLHRDHASRPGACVRVTWTRTDPGMLDRAVDSYRVMMMPALDELDGFCSASLLVDRESGHAVSSMTFDSMEAMNSCREQIRSMSESGRRDSGTEIVDTAEFELAIAHLRVPELV